MHQLRDALLSPSPKGPDELTPSDQDVFERSDFRATIARGEIQELRGLAFYNRTWIVSERFCSLGDGVDSLEGYVHSLWLIYYELARHTSHESTDHDRLVLDILRIQGLGPLTRPATGNYGIDIARTADGILWNDLPFLAIDMTEHWIKNCGPMSGAHRLNLTSFFAKLASVRVSKERICQIALVLFRSTFEERRALRTTESPEDEDPRRMMDGLDIVHLLPAVCIWIKEASYNLTLLSDVYWNECPSDIGKGGQLYIESDLGSRTPTGFSPWRWMFWLKRLHEIQEEAKAENETSLEESATDAIERMVEHARERKSGVLRAYASGGEALHQDRHLKCLKPETEAGEDIISKTET